MITLDLSIPSHADAFVRAASHYLTSLPTTDARRLYAALLSDEDEEDPQITADRNELVVWEAIDNWCELECPFDPRSVLLELIEVLAKDFIDYKESKL